MTRLKDPNIYILIGVVVYVVLAITALWMLAPK